MNWQFAPYIIPLLLAIGLALMVASLSWRRPTGGARALSILMLAIVVWSLGYLLEIVSIGLSAKLLWGKFQYVGIVIVPIAWLAFALYFTDHSQWLSRRNIIGLSIIPVITLTMIWTTERHGWHWDLIRVGTNGPFSALVVTYGYWFWIHSAFSYILLVYGTFLLCRRLLRRSNLYRLQAFMIVLAVVAPLLANGFYIFGLIPGLILDPTPFALAVSGGALGWALFRFRLLDIVPVARRTVVEVMSDGVIVIDAQNRVVDINPTAQQIVGWSAAKAVGKPAELVFAAWPMLMVRFGNQDHVHTEIDLGEDRIQRFFDLRISPLYNRQRELTGRLIVLRDITETKFAEQELIKARDQAMKANRLKSELLAKVSHELRTPLGAILGFAEMLQEGFYGSLNERQAEATVEIVDSTQYLNRMVNELLDQAQLDARKVQLRNRLFRPAQIVEPVQAKMMVLAHSKGLTLSVDISPDLPKSLLGDPGRLQQILVNLVGNAIKFTTWGSVQIRLCCPDSTHWAMSVVDTGPGIPLEAQAIIFEPFGQVDGSITREHTGTGLGLSIVKSLTQLMGGDISLKSEVGQGSTFTVTLPLKHTTESLPASTSQSDNN